MSNDFIFKEIEYNQAVREDGIMVLNSAVPNINRNQFFENIDNYKLSELQARYYPLSVKQHIKYIIKDILNYMGLLEKIDRIR